jgi:hypothetical protein
MIDVIYVPKRLVTENVSFSSSATSKHESSLTTAFIFFYPSTYSSHSSKTEVDNVRYPSQLVR